MQKSIQQNCKFSLEHYKECIQTALDKGYKIGRVRDYQVLGRKYILLRHDVDFSVDYAYKMALVDKELGVNSTFYILLHSTTYNALSPHNQQLIKDIAKMGHEIGWQIDTRYTVPYEERLLEHMISRQVESYAQHYCTLTDKPKESWGIDAMDWDELGVKYISESSRNWREQCMCHWIEDEKKERLEILTHPIWWMTKTNSRREAIEKLHGDLYFAIHNAVNEYREIVKNYLSELSIEFDSDEQLQPCRVLEASG